MGVCHFNLKSSTQKSRNLPEIETQKSGNLPEIETQKSGNLPETLGFFLSEKTYHPDKKIKEFYYFTLF